MSHTGPQLWLIRHGETEWSRSGQHTSRTDLELTAEGIERAKALGVELRGQTFDAVYSSPMRRALDTCRLVGLTPTEVLPELREWDYGDYEGLTTPQIRETNPGWSIWSAHAPNGESARQIGARADALLTRLEEQTGQIALFSHGHFLRVLGSRWISLPASHGKLLALDTGSISILGYERTTRVIRLWNRLIRP